MFSFFTWFSPLFFGCFNCWLHFFMSPTFFTLTAFLHCFFVRYFVFVLLCCKCYRFETAFVTLRRFLSYTSSPHLLQYWGCYGSDRAFFILRCFLPYTRLQHLAQSAFIKASLGAGSSSLKVTGSPTEVQNTDPIHLLVYITQCSVKIISW